ncbi:hypothetical protein DXV75_16280 [Alteromonas aestuariivivens]|uniref:Uncharacterized protein n=1 Tax=Alteromonas aestuariivivens TaxID=1938339 RepID=A0A3D8M327_9ALTE|nr:hypothetical protein [Alteromonas aestuariivivens]RDV24016.1 hypothetical protein DXV75_16280 [Alteromonas aestuariivivens]
MKNFILAIVIAIVLVNVFGSVASDWWGVHFVMSDGLMSPFENLLAFSAIAVVFVIIGFIVAISVVGAIILGVAAALLSILVLGVTALWPLLLVAAVIYWLQRNKRNYADEM